jgi:hypothetical protein
MKYITVIYLIIIATYNLLGDNDSTCILFGNEIYYWRIIYFFFVHLTLTFSFIELRNKAIGKSRKIYLGGAIFSGFYTLFQIFTLTSNTIAEYLGMINSELWSIIFFSIVVLLILFSYDSTNARKTG